MSPRRHRLERLLTPSREHGRGPLEHSRRLGGRRLAASLTFAVLFFAGAAFSAGAGDMVAEAVDSTTEAAAPAQAEPECTARMRELDPEECAGEPALAEPAPAPVETAPPAEPDPAAPAPAPEADQPAAAPSEPAPAEEADDDLRPAGARPVAPRTPTAPAPAPARAHVKPRPGAKLSARPSAKPAARPVLAPKPHAEHRESGHEPERGTADFGTLWLDRDLPDPTPPARRLTRAFARDLKAASRQADVRWADVLAVLRARGDRSQAPSGRAGLDALAGRLAELGAREDSWNAFLALEGRTSFADRALALSRYHRAVGLSALVRGLEWATPGLVKRVLADERIEIYPGGRQDVEEGRTDVRVLVLLRYLAEAHDQVTVTSLISGHGYFSRPGVVSAHMYGLAVDIAALGGVSMTGNQQPGSVTEKAVRNVLLLPAELRPLQVISLLGLGGPSFPLANHHDHIHVGY